MNYLINPPWTKLFSREKEAIARFSQIFHFQIITLYSPRRINHRLYLYVQTRLYASDYLFLRILFTDFYRFTDFFFLNLI